MNQKKQKSAKGANTKANPAIKKGREEQTPKSTTEITKRKKNYDADEFVSSNNLKGSRKTRDKNSSKNDPSLMESEHPAGKLVDHDEFQEAVDFLESLKQNTKKSQTKKVSMEIEKVEDEWEILKKECKKLTQLAFGTFEKIKLRFDPVRPKIGTTTEINIEKEPKIEDKIEEEVPVIAERNNSAMEIEEKKEEVPKRRIIDLLKANINLDDDGKNDDRLANISFEPTLEMMRTSTHIDVESVCNLIEQSKKNTGTMDDSATKVMIDNLSENHQKINELVSSISEADFQRLQPEVYLNDTLINFYLKYIFRFN